MNSVDEMFVTDTDKSEMNLIKLITSVFAINDYF